MSETGINPRRKTFTLYNGIGYDIYLILLIFSHMTIGGI